MGPPTRSPESAAVLVVDASVVINLNATAYPGKIIGALAERIVIVDAVIDELERGRSKGRRDADQLQQLVVSGLIEATSLGSVGLDHVERLVVGPATETLDDGEAATIAYALEKNADAVIDERKAIRLCAARFPHISVLSTVDILARREVERTLGRPSLSDAVFNALQFARMRVPAKHIGWVVDLIGAERASKCSSLPRSARNSGSRDTGATR